MIRFTTISGAVVFIGQILLEVSHLSGSLQQNYLSACADTCIFSLALSPIFVNIMIFINSIKSIDHDLANIYFIKQH